MSTHIFLGRNALTELLTLAAKWALPRLAVYLAASVAGAVLFLGWAVFYTYVWLEHPAKFAPTSTPPSLRLPTTKPAPKQNENITPNPEIAALVAQAERLKTDAQEALKMLDESQRRLEANLNNMQTLQQNFDEMKNALSKIAAELAVDSSYLNALRDFKRVANERAIRAETSRDPNLQKFRIIYMEQVSRAEETRAEATRLHFTLVSDLTRLERGKEELLYALRARNIDLAAKTRSDFGSAKIALQGTAELVVRTKALGGPFKAN